MYYTQEILIKDWKPDLEEGVLAKFKAHLAKGAYPALSITTGSDDLQPLYPIAQEFKEKFETIIILGTGGSSLGAQALCALRYVGLGFPQPNPALYFMDNIDPQTFADLLKSMAIQKTGVIAISKSGSTAETLCQLSVLLEKWEKTLGQERLKDHFIILTEKKDSPLYRVGQDYKLRILDHHPQIGGRFSVFSTVGALPALLASIDFIKIRKGAQSVLKAPEIPLQGAHALYTLYKERGFTSTVMMPYLDRLYCFASWFRQLWAESLGKDGLGITPIRALGTVDQHSQTQLYLDGPKDKFFTFILANQKGKGEKVSSHDTELTYLHQKTMGDLLDAEQRATVDSLHEKACPIRILAIDSLTEETLGALLMHFMIETISLALMLGIDAFNQPAVERGKILTRKYLKENI